MKSIVEYAHERQQQITQLNEMSSIEGDLILESTFFSRLAKFLGSKANQIKKRWEEYKKDFINFPDNVKKAFNGFMANANDEGDKLPSDKRQDIIDQVTSKKVEDIPTTVAELIKNNKTDPDFKNSATAAYLTALGINIAKAKGNTEALNELQQFFKEIPTDVKKKASDNFKQAVNDNKPTEGGEQTQDGGNGGEQTEGEGNGTEQTSEETQKKTEEVAAQVVQQEEIKQAAEKANINTDELKNKIMYIINDLNNDNKDVDVDELDDLCMAIAEIICGAKTIQGNEKINNDILTKYKIGNLEEFIKSIETK